VKEWKSEEEEAKKKFNGNVYFEDTCTSGRTEQFREIVKSKE
jgi:hypothetical protein